MKTKGVLGQRIVAIEQGLQMINGKRVYTVGSIKLENGVILVPVPEVLEDDYAVSVMVGHPNKDGTYRWEKP